MLMHRLIFYVFYSCFAIKYGDGHHVFGNMYKK